MPNNKTSKKASAFTLTTLENQAAVVRENIIKMLLEAQSGHSAGSLGMADIFTALYFYILNINPHNPSDPNRDRLVLSNGHICPVLYTCLALKGFFEKKELKTLRKINSKLQGHPHNLALPGIETSSGPLGQGLSQAIGMAIASKIDNNPYNVYCITGDGELNEGQIWEAAMYAGNSRLNNLTWIIDRNNIQIDGFTEDVMPLEPLKDKLEAFNWYVIQINGHNFEEIINSLELAKIVVERPVAILAHTIPGKGVDFMQYKFEWHGKTPNSEQAQQALHQIRTLEGRLRSIHE